MLKTAYKCHILPGLLKSAHTLNQATPATHPLALLTSTPQVQERDQRWSGGPGHQVHRAPGSRPNRCATPFTLHPPLQSSSSLPLLPLHLHPLPPGCPMVSSVTPVSRRGAPSSLVLARLDLSECPGLEDGGLARLLQASPALTHLYLRRCQGVTGATSPSPSCSTSPS